MTATAAVPLQDWQKRYVEDGSRRKLLVKSVQVGGSFVASLECALDTVEHGGLWIMLSASDRQSMELMEKVKIHTAGWGVVTKTGFFEDTSIVQHTAKFPNRGRILALPANADTARGFSGNVLLDEFAIHRDAKAIWKSMVGRTMRGYKLRVLSSFKGKQNKFFDLAKECGLEKGEEPVVQPVHAGVWSGHWVDIHMAVREGLEVDIDELRATVGDDEIWMEEFECVPIDSAMDFISFDLIRGCETDEATTEFDYVKRPEQYAGFDIARRRDLSDIWILSREPNGLLTRGLISMPRMKFSDQKAIACRVAACVDRFDIDQTGIGMNLAEDLKEEFPGVVEGVDFTGAKKEALATATKTAFEDRLIGIPENAVIRRSVQAVKRYMTPAGNIRFDANRTDAGHADEFWALALAIEAAGEKRGYVAAADCEVNARTVIGELMEAAF
jgi:phage FluMu gp28-like protein